MFGDRKEIKQVEELKLSNASNIIGKGTLFNGDIETYGNIRVEGEITGNMKIKSKVACGHSSYIKGNVLAQNAEIAGRLTGNVVVSELLILKSSAIIKGDIITNKLVVEAGATFNGECKMGVTMKEIQIGDKAKRKETLLKVQ